MNLKNQTVFALFQILGDFFWFYLSYMITAVLMIQMIFLILNEISPD